MIHVRTGYGVFVFVSSKIVKKLKTLIYILHPHTITDHGKKLLDVCLDGTALVCRSYLVNLQCDYCQGLVSHGSVLTNWTT